MKKLLLFLSLLPVLVQAQQFELGANYGTTFDATISIKLFHHLKAGVGYQYAKFTSTDIFGVSSKTTMDVFYGFIEYYHTYKKKNEFYYGIDAGRIDLMNLLPGLSYMSGNEYGTHAGYSRKIFKGLAGNVQIGFFYFHTKISSYVYGTTNAYGVFFPATIGLHYVIGANRKKTK